MKKHVSQTITEDKLRKIINEELVLYYSLNEGMWDDARDGVKKLSAIVSKKFKTVAASWAKSIVESLSKFEGGIPDDVKKIFGVIKDVMQSTGEKFQLSEELIAAKKFGQISNAFALSLVQQDLEGPVHEKAVKVNEHFVNDVQDLLIESSDNKQLNEVGVTAVLGVGLAIMGGLPMLFKGLHKLALYLGAEKSAELFEKAEHVTHSFEKKTINFAVPYKLTYAVYEGLWKLGIKLTNTHLNELELKAEDEGKKAILKTNDLIYKVILIYFAFNGISGVLKAGASMLGFVEGAATTVKGIELANGAKEVAKLVAVFSVESV